jgi:hypothetical protein
MVNEYLAKKSALNDIAYAEEMAMIQQYAKAFPLPRFGIQHSRSSTFPKESS